ncbi:hypothetical protein DOY81_009676 [Sarcophaga bullata]|nr:hypothetical protein DOY81_009676 [Sarcophaga bullata]
MMSETDEYIMESIRKYMNTIANTYNISESSVEITSDSGSDQELEYLPPTKLSKMKVEKEECLTQCVDASSTVCVEDTSQSEFMDAPSSSTYLGEAEDSRRTNDEQTDVPSSSIRVVKIQQDQLLNLV